MMGKPGTKEERPTRSQIDRQTKRQIDKATGRQRDRLEEWASQRASQLESEKEREREGGGKRERERGKREREYNCCFLFDPVCISMRCRQEQWTVNITFEMNEGTKEMMKSAVPKIQRMWRTAQTLQTTLSGRHSFRGNLGFNSTLKKAHSNQINSL